jgi:hypothetical protein
MKLTRPGRSVSSSYPPNFHCLGSKSKLKASAKKLIKYLMFISLVKPMRLGRLVSFPSSLFIDIFMLTFFQASKEKSKHGSSCDSFQDLDLVVEERGLGSQLRYLKSTVLSPSYFEYRDNIALVRIFDQSVIVATMLLSVP